MQIFGCVEKNGDSFNFHSKSCIKGLINCEEVHIFSDNKIFVYIDGIITNLSHEAEKISSDYNHLKKKVAYLYSVGFNLESHICGSFNLFLFNYKNKELKIIRDSRGTRSIFFAKHGSDLIFSSDQDTIIKKIKHISLNKNKLIEFLNWDYKSSNETYFKEIFRVEPRHYLIFNNSSIVSKKYKLSEDLFSSNKDSKTNFKELLYQSVSNIIDRDKNIGVMMSGGLDSSAIAIALMENNFNDVRTYSANFSHISKIETIDETIFQKNISNLTSYKHTHIQMEDKSTIKPIQKFTKIFNQPIIFPNIYLFDEVIKKLRADNIEVILDGHDGDNTVSHGFEVLYFYFIRLRFYKFIKEIYLYSRFKNASFKRLLYIFTKQAFKKFFNIKNRESKNSILKNNIKIKKNQKNIISFFSSHEEKLNIDLHYLGNEYRSYLFKYFDIENFSPFYDEILIDFCINMPNKDKFNDGYTRTILRNFLSNFLPEEHFNRDKSILTSGLIKNFNDFDLSIVNTELKNLNKNLLELVDIEKLHNIIENFKDGQNIEEEQLINLQIFVSANTFLNYHNL